METGAATLLDSLRRVPGGRLVRIRADGGEVRLAYGEARLRADRILGGLRARGAVPGDEVVLQIEAAEDFLPALWACLAGGFVAVPAAVPEPGVGDGSVGRRLHDAWSVLDGPLVVAADAVCADTASLLGESARIVALSEVAAHDASPVWHAPSPDSTALLLLSSGTTGRPKLVRRTHRNLLLACHFAVASSRLSGRAVTFVNWLPLDHNAGIMAALTLLVSGAHQVHLGTRDVIDEPGRWLEALHRYGATHAGATGYFLGRVNDRLAGARDRAWDFSAVERITLTAEPVAARTARTFLDRMEPFGLRPDALCSSYGTSEAGGITRLDALRPEAASLGDGFLKVGVPLPGIVVRVVDTEGYVVPEGCEGRIQVRGEMVTPGYARDPELTLASFTGDGWLDTGDAGFLERGSLALTGRMADVLIVNGLNLQGREVEAAVEEVDGVERGYTAVCPVRAPGRETEAVAVFLHTHRSGAAERSALRREVRRAVASRYAVPVAHVLLLDPAELPRTALGKIRRAELRRMLAEGEFARHAAEDAAGAGVAEGGAPRTGLERELCALWAEVLGVDAVGVYDDFLGLGGHSLLAARIAARARAVSGVEVPLRKVFEASTVAELAAWIETSGREEGGALLPPVTRVPREGPVPASHGQRGLWLFEHVQPGSSVYNLPCALRLHGTLHVAALGRALGEVVRRHEALRTVFTEIDGEPWQDVLPAVPPSLPVVELGALGVAAREAATAAWTRYLAEQPFDLGRGPLFRAALLRLGAAEHVLVISMHHAVSDGWSIGVLYRELEALYGAFVRGEASPLPEPAVQYGDYALWQRSPEVEEVLEGQLGWWRERLAGAPARLELPTDRARPAVQDHRGGAHRFELAPELWEWVRAAAREAGVTPFMLLLGAFQALLGRYGRTEDVVVGTPVAGRGRREVEGLVGYFVNTLALRTDLSGDPSVGGLLERVREGTLEAFARQEVPFGRVVGAVAPERSRGHAPIFQVMFAFQNAPAGLPRLAGLDAAPVRVGRGAAMFDLSLSLGEEGGGARGLVEYAAGLFEAETVERLARHYRVLLEGMLAGGSGRALGELTLLDARERDEVLGRWNATEGTDPGEEGLHAPFERRAAAAPGAVALVFEGGTLTYGELDSRAENVARRLRALGVGPDVVVGICGERSAELIVALLAVLKAGGAYLPLDPAHPAERLAYMLADSRPRVLLVHPAARAALPSFKGPVLALDDELFAPDATGASSSGDPLADMGGSRLAYVIYTSGSTGRPKGVMIAHRSIRNRVLWAHEQHPLGPDDVVLLKTPLTFDASIWELFLPLWSGARVVVAAPEGHQDPAYLARALADHGVTMLQLVPSVLQLLLVQPEAERCMTLRLVSCGGEAFPVEVARRAAEVFGARVVNTYGPTEASIDVSAWEYRGDEEGAVLPIGRPVTGTHLYLLDAGLEPVPVGVPGEVYASGPGLARGYMGRAELTAEKFVPDPFSGEVGGRLYRTGDVGRRRGDGTVEFLGRTDQQVKLRGLRIEPGEIEALLAQHAAVETAVVAVRADAPGGDALVAYVVAAPGAAPTPAGLRAHLRERLPEYMLPAAFVLLPELPRTASGKVDRGALPAPTAADLAARGGYLPPRTPVEEALVEVWEEVVGTRPIGVRDDFFELGGHSLSAVRLVARVQAVLGVELPLHVLFDAPTVAGVAEALERAGAAHVPEPPLLPAPRGESVPLSFAQQRLWLLHQLEPESPAYNLIDLLVLPGEADPAALEGALADLFERHEALRTSFPAGDGAGEQRVHPPRPVALPVLDFRGRPVEEQSAEARLAVREEVLRPFDLAEAPLLRPTLVRLDDGDRLLLVMHHVVSDGWSVGVIAEEVAALYAARLRGEPSPLPPLPVQYADFTLWERAWLRGEVLESHLAYWRGRLAGAPQVIDLPTDRARPLVQSYRGGARTLRLPADLSGSLRKLGRASSATLFMTLLASFKALLQRYGAGDDLVVGTHVANRGRLEVERLVGFFVNALVLRTDLSGDPSFQEAMRRVRGTALEAFAHQRLPFERVVEELQPRRDLSVTPLYQVSFDLQQGGSTLDARSRGLLSGSPTAKFDLEATAADGPDGLTFHLAYAADLYDDATAGRILRHWEMLLRSAAAEPALPVSALGLLDEAETRQLLGEFQGERRAYPLDRTLDRLFAEQAARTPGAVAAVAGEARVTYAELARRTEHVAALLRRAGVGRGDFVGILEERGIDFLVGILAVLRAGGAYLPLDPTYPEGRIRHMLADSGVSVLLTRSGVASAFAGAIASSPELATTLCFDALPDAPADDDATAPGRTHPGDPAYMLYTSGSTGLPKGAVIRHDGAVNHIFAQLDVLELDPEFCFLQSAPASSDISVWQFLAPLVVGGRTVIVDADTVSDADALLRVIREERVTIVELVPGVLHALLERVSALPEGERGLPELRWIMATGEEVPVDLVNAWLRACPGIRLTNAYGPTEASDDVTQLVIDRPLPETARSVSIGGPLPNLDCHVVDPAWRLVPVGVPGELCIGGIAVGNGYHGNPRRTAASFVPDPFAAAPGGVMYRTGDRVRWLADGTLEFLGRIDRQVKVRGFRIELGEIEAALRECPGVRDCAVVVREEEGDRKLAAYLVAAPGGEADPAVLRARLRDRLPGHMVPALFVALEALPLTPAGKVDRRALAADRRGGEEERAEHVAPRTPTEEALAAIWAAVLGRDRVSVEADLFDLGAHSLLAAMAASRVRDALAVKLPLRRFFEHTTVARLAAHVDSLAAGDPQGSGPTLQRVARSARRVGTVAAGTLRTL